MPYVQRASNIEFTVLIVLIISRIVVFSKTISNIDLNEGPLLAGVQSLNVPSPSY